MALTDLRIRSLKPKDRAYKAFDAGQLYIVVQPTGSKLWRMNYKLGGSNKTISFGAYPNVTLGEARRLRDEAKLSVEAGIDPTLERKKIRTLREQAATSESFADVADRWFRVNRSEWVEGYAARMRARMLNDVYPYVGKTPINQVTPTMLLDIARRIEGRGAVEMAKRVMNHVSQVLRFAVAEGLIPSDPTRDIMGAMMPAQPVRHRTAPRDADLGPMLRAIRSYNEDRGVVSLGLQLVMHTWVRTKEARFATWDQFEGLGTMEPIWRVPAGNMKMRREHIIPLTPQVVAIVEGLRAINGHRKWVMASPAPYIEKPVSENAMIYALYRMGYYGKATVHGFRSTASTLANEADWNPDWIEMQLAHVDGTVRGVYNSAKWLKGRREMLTWWSNLLDEKARQHAGVVEQFADLLG